MNPRRIVHILALIACSAAAVSPDVISTALAQETTRFNRLTAADGLPHHEVYATARDSTGRLWIATRAGLRRWDGNRIEYPSELAASVIGREWVHALHVADDSTLLAGTAGSGLYRVDYRTGSVDLVQASSSCAPRPGDVAADLFVVSVTSLSGGRMAVSTNRNGLWLLHASGAFCPAPLTGSEEVIDRIGSITAVLETADGTLWTGTWSKGLYSLHPDETSSVYHVHAHELSLLPNGRVRALHALSSDTLLIGTSGAGLIAYDTKNGQDVRATDLFGPAVADLHPKPWTFASSPDSTLFIGTYGGGLARLDLSTGDLEQFRHDESDVRTIPGNDASHVYIDPFGLLWVSTGSGLASTTVTSPVRRTYALPERITALGPADPDRILVGSATSVYEIDRVSGRPRLLTELAVVTGRPTGNDVTVIAEHPRGVIVGTADNGAILIPVDGPARQLSLVGPDFADSRAVADIAVAPDSTVLVSGFRLGLVELSRDLKVRHHMDRGNAIVSENIIFPSSVLSLDFSRWLIGGFRTGLHVVDLKNGTHSRLAPSSGPPLDPGLDRITDMDFGDRSDGDAWITTGAGLIRLDLESGSAIRWPPNAVREDRQLIGLAYDAPDRVWTLTDRWITRASADADATDILRIHALPDGTSAHVDRGITRLDRKTVVVAGDRTVMEIDATYGAPRRPEPIVNLYVAGQRSQPLNARDGIVVLPRSADGFGLDVTVPDLHDPGSVRIMYGLFGVDSTFKSVETASVGDTYVNLEPRNRPYQLRIRTEDSRGYATTTALDVKVLPPLWKTAWFISMISFFLAGGLAIVLAATYSQRRQEAMEIQAALVASREEERAMLSRLLHDETIQNLLSARRLITDRDGAARALGESESEQLARLLSESTDQLRRICGDLRPETLDAFGLPATLSSTLRRYRANRPHVAIETAISNDVALGSSQARTLYRIFQVALANIDRHAQAETVSIRLAEDSGRVIFTVADDGVGFDPPDSRLSLARNRQFGLLGMREWADAIQASLEIESAPGRGTRIRVTVPVNDDHRPSANAPATAPSLFLRFRRFIHG